VPPASPVRRARRSFATVFLTGLFAASVMAACGLDWTVRSDAGDASPVAEGGIDVIADSPIAVDVTDTSPPIDAPLSPDAMACNALAADLNGKKAKAKDCQVGMTGQCTSTVDDECGCPVVVRFAVGTPTTEYKDAIATFVASCGKPPAGSCLCPQIGLPGSWSCVFNAGVPRCTP
jgi:hypothetical protein